MRELPLIAPNVPRLSEMTEELRALEGSGVFSNGGPVVRGFEAAACARLFAGRGACLAVSNATLGLAIAIRDAAGRHPAGKVAAGNLALMPAFTFAATAHAAQWAGLTPLICDVAADDWSAAAAAEEALLRRFCDRVAVLVPYATFGAAIDLDRYAWLAREHGVGVVVDAAASLGTLNHDGGAFGAGAPFAVVHSMHATKTFAVGEGGLVHSGDVALIERLRRMTNFGFGAARNAEGPGINGKLPEVLGLVAHAKLDELDRVADHREALARAYRAGLEGFGLQRVTASRQAMQFMPLMLPAPLAAARPRIIAAMQAARIGCGAYFSPHLAQQPWFAESCIAEPTPVADDVAGRILSLPITDAMTTAEVAHVCATLHEACVAALPRRAPARAKAVPPLRTVIVGGGPAGTALLLAAAKRGRLDALAPGLVLVESGPAIGAGRLGGYAITSDSSAETFLSAVRDNPSAPLAALAGHAVASAVERHSGELGVPLAATGPLLGAIGRELRALVEAHGGRVLTRTKATGAERQRGGQWRLRLCDEASGERHELDAANIVIATGGWQPVGATADARVGGVPLGAFGDRVVMSDSVLRTGGLRRVRARLSGVPAPRIVIVGGSTSALAVAALLLRSSPAAPLALGQDAVTLLHRRPLRPFYPSADAARADGFTDFTPADICPISGFVYRLGGFRLEARALLLRMLAIGGRAPDPRLRLHRLAEGEDAYAQAMLRQADLIVAALGYRPRVLPLHAADGTAIALGADATGTPLVDRSCRVLDATGAAIAGLYGIGLAAGFVPSGPLGGEPSFRGQANGLWLWQNDVGAMIVDQLLPGGAAVRAA